ncbi:MAG TPA: hypothetical protein PK275_03765 [Chitinophagaceae bacterium]|nr:hypothetical protein [Chitinophagaceae bacterium]
MSKFITLKETYNPLTTQGLGEKSINTSEIIHISRLAFSPYKRIKTIKSRIHLTNGEIFDVKISNEEILLMINKVL